METLIFETGVSDHHKLIVTMLNSKFSKRKPTEIFYGCYKYFNNEKFEEKLKQKNQCQILNHFILHLESPICSSY